MTTPPKPEGLLPLEKIPPHTFGASFTLSKKQSESNKKYYQAAEELTRTRPTPPSDGAAAVLNSPDFRSKAPLGDAAHGDTAVAAALPEGVLSAQEFILDIFDYVKSTGRFSPLGFDACEFISRLEARDVRLSQAKAEEIIGKLQTKVARYKEALFVFHGSLDIMRDILKHYQPCVRDKDYYEFLQKVDELIKKYRPWAKNIAAAAHAEDKTNV